MVGGEGICDMVEDGRVTSMKCGLVCQMGWTEKPFDVASG